MRHHSSDSFILATYPLREKDRIVSFLTRDAGKKRGVARGSRGARSQFGGLLEPMTEARVTYFEKDAQELVSINSVDAIRPSFTLSKNLEQGLLVSALAESLQTFVSDSDPAEHFYRLARHVLDALFAGASPWGVRSYFDLWILRLSGLFPTPAECAACGKPLETGERLLFDPSRPGFIGPECRAGEVVRLSPAAAQTLRAFLSAPFDPARTYKGVAEISAVSGLARRHFLGHELKSQRVLSEVLGA
jgi:DNA repair protein RecO (recombination protein O)